VLAQQSTISNNTAAGQGGGIYITGVGPDANAYCDLYWTTVASNTASSGGGVYVLSTAADPVDTATENSIVASNQRPGGTLDDYRGNPHFPNPIMPHQRSLFRSTLGTTNTALDLIANPLLLGLNFYNGGPTKTRALPASSPAVNAAPAGADCPDFDQTFGSRPVGPLCDLGSFEYR
jgi:predicted outer membrane repeat protein